MTLFRTRIHSYVLCMVAIFEHCCLRSPLGYPSLANSASFCTALWCNVSASLAMRCTLSRAELRAKDRSPLFERCCALKPLVSPYLIWLLQCIILFEPEPEFVVLNLKCALEEGVLLRRVFQAAL